MRYRGGRDDRFEGGEDVALGVEEAVENFPACGSTCIFIWIIADVSKQLPE